MFIVTVRVHWAAPVTVKSARLVHAAIEAAASQGDGLEHVYVQTEGPEAGVVLFLLAPDLARAEATAARLVGRAVGDGSAGWRVLSCQAELLMPFSEAALPPDD
jgi:hypothetical protein